MPTSVPPFLWPLRCARAYRIQNLPKSIWGNILNLAIAHRCHATFTTVAYSRNKANWLLWIGILFLEFWLPKNGIAIAAIRGNAKVQGCWFDPLNSDQPHTSEKIGDEGKGGEMFPTLWISRCWRVKPRKWRKPCKEGEDGEKNFNRVVEIVLGI